MKDNTDKKGEVNTNWNIDVFILRLREGSGFDSTSRNSQLLNAFSYVVILLCRIHL